MNLTWDEYFMNMALLASKRSKDPNTKVGAIIVDKNNKILGTGYNGHVSIPSNDIIFPWDDNKYEYVVHAELNAIMNTIIKNTEGASIYTTLFPCNECAKALIQSKIKKVVYLEDKYANKKSFKISREMLKASGVHLVDYFEISKRIYLDLLDSMELTQKAEPPCLN